ncbi:uncharacterized protein MICPUCDRAFT_62702 [Micromonas pusilla CCMP1545]|uniref:Predicted protein n=2 Tax=Micromonas pusilla TaxID=38833 RepID=C1MN85_MICPC|nr:uncharacterized protein MICPUCDRAFT_62702 [Micromonas pusilla CCMP1545]EEH58706.1 predicted protein [Micromonas pusilla CCMP1545]|eukprot:XP_003057061.1 predicted protein [Micromonas pusilla CCMP1545]
MCRGSARPSRAHTRARRVRTTPAAIMAAADASEAPPRRGDAEMDAIAEEEPAVAGPSTADEREPRDDDADDENEEETPDALFAMLTPAFLEHKSRASLDAEEAHGLARMLAEVSDEGIAETQVDGALALARNVIRAFLRANAEGASSSDDATTRRSRAKPKKRTPEPSPQNDVAVTSYVPSTAASAHEVARAAATARAHESEIRALEMKHAAKLDALADDLAETEAHCAALATDNARLEDAMTRAMEDAAAARRGGHGGMIARGPGAATPTTTSPGTERARRAELDAAADAVDAADAEAERAREECLALREQLRDAREEAVRATRRKETIERARLTQFADQAEKDARVDALRKQLKATRKALTAQREETETALRELKAVNDFAEQREVERLIEVRKEAREKGKENLRSATHVEAAFRAKCVKGMQDMLEVNKKLEARVLQERERRVTAEAEVGQLKRTLTFQRTVGAMQSFMRRGRVEDVEDEGAARILDDAATVIQRRYRGIAGRKKAREMCREIFEEDSPYDEHDGVDATIKDLVDATVERALARAGDA